jgi:hypothetical protein
VRLAILAGSSRRAQAFMGAGTAASPLVAIFKTSSLGVAMMRTLMAANSLGSDGIGHVRHGRVMMGRMMAATFGASGAAAEGHAALAGDNRRVREKTRAESAARPLVTITLTMMMDRGGGRGRGLAGSPRLGASQAKAPQAPPTSEPSDTGADVATGTTRRSVHIKGAAPRSHALDGAVGQRVAGGGGCEAHFRFHANVWAGVGGQRHNSQFAGPSHGRRGRGSPTRRALLQAHVAVRHHTSIAHGAERAHGTTSEHDRPETETHDHDDDDWSPFQGGLGIAPLAHVLVDSQRGLRRPVAIDFRRLAHVRPRRVGEEAGLWFGGRRSLGLSPDDRHAESDEDECAPIVHESCRYPPWASSCHLVAPPGLLALCLLH